MAIELAKESPDIGIVVQDAEKSLAFYRDTLGLPYERKLESPDGSVVHFLGLGTSSLKIWQVNPVPAPRAPGGGYREAQGIRYITLVLRNIEQVVSQCSASGVTVTAPLSQPRPDLKLAFIQDPDGNNIELLQRMSV
jgi:catechol 2,3-dioxygenase-like lactoylglutathione lyase family enzyme